MIRSLAMAATLLLALSGAAQEKNPHVVLHTQAGDIELELDAVHAPATVANFLRYVNGGFYAGGAFSRTVTMANQPDNAIKIEVIQANTNPARRAEGFGNIALERTSVTGLHHLDGTISMGRSAAADSASSEIFICIGDQPSLDFGGKRNPDGQGFAAFGQVVKGMDVVRKIQMSPAEKQKLVPAVGIVGAEEVKSRDWEEMTRCMPIACSYVAGMWVLKMLRSCSISAGDISRLGIGTNSRFPFMKSTNVAWFSANLE